MSCGGYRPVSRPAKVKKEEPTPAPAEVDNTADLGKMLDNLAEQANDLTQIRRREKV